VRKGLVLGLLGVLTLAMVLGAAGLTPLQAITKLYELREKARGPNP